MARTTCGEMVAATRPSFTSDRMKFAASAATTMSQAAASPTPPPNASPCTRPITGREQECTAWNMRATFSASAWLSA